LASSPSELKRKVLDTFLVPELLYAEEAERLKLGDRRGVQSRERDVLRAAMDRELHQETSRKVPVTTADIRGYFEANRGRFETPRRVHLWRILSDDEALIKKIIADCKGADGIQRWSQYARESSLDKATHLRNGELGFVHPDGDTDTPTLRVDQALFAAADQLKDGELAGEPIKEGLHWAAVWRRGSMKAVSRTLEQEQGSIRQVLERQRVEEARGALLTTLRARFVTAFDETALESLHFDTAGLPTHEAAAPSAHPAIAGSSVPQPSEHGTR
jgi:peptidyl-prolyl cis-trans isomerase C